MNLVERFFGDLSGQSIHNGSFRSIGELSKRIEDYIAAHNLEPKRYIWRKDGAEILNKINRAKKKLDEDN